VLDDLEDNTNDADGRWTSVRRQAILSDALADLEKGPTP
jgi:hypothetical protein